MSANNSFLPVPEFVENELSHSFKHNTSNEQCRSKRPPKLLVKHNHDSSFMKSINASTAHVISFNGNHTAGSPMYLPTNDEPYFEQRFEVLELLGEGSFSQVFKVRSRDDGNLYAVKKSKLPFKSELNRKERLEEVRRHEQLSMHEHCITLYHAWEQDAYLYMQMELCQENLETFVAKRQLINESMVWNILVDLLLALKALHDSNLIHLDIKLENILINDNFECKLGDFGLVVDLNNPNLHQACEGDSRYIAPELMRSKFTKAADIFSLGITILELACNMELPNNGPLWQQLRENIFPQFLSLISIDLQNIIRSTMNSSFQERPTVDELLHLPRVQTILKTRHRLKPLKRFIASQTKIRRCMSQTMCNIRSAFVWFFSLMVSAFSLNSTKHVPRTPRRLATPTVHPPTPAASSPSNSLLLLEDSEIEGSPAKQTSTLKVDSSSRFVNSTPLNHFRKTRSDYSVDADNAHNSTHPEQFSPYMNHFRVSGGNSIDLQTSLCKRLFSQFDDEESQ